MAISSDGSVFLTPSFFYNYFNRFILCFQIVGVFLIVPSNHNWFSLRLKSIYWAGYVVQFLLNQLDHDSESVTVPMHSMKKLPYFCLLGVLQFPACSLPSFTSLHRAGDAWNAEVSGTVTGLMWTLP